MTIRFSQKYEIGGHEIFELFFGKILDQKFKNSQEADQSF